MKYIIAPVHITPTKPLVPSHINHLIFTDVLYKATKLQNSATLYAYDRNMVGNGPQVAKLVAYLNTHPTKLTTATDVGRVYIQANADPISKNQRAHLTSLHPAVQIVLESWTQQHQFLNLYNPGFQGSAFSTLTPTEVLETLSQLNILLDSRHLGGGTYLDLTSLGLSLKQLTDNSGASSNFLMDELRLLLALTRPGDHVVLIYDQEVSLVYSLLKQVLLLQKAAVKIYLTNRVSTYGRHFSSREGGWEKYTLEKIVSRYLPVYSQAEIKFGLKLYFLKRQRDFTFESLDLYLTKAQKILSDLSSVTPVSFPVPTSPYSICDLVLSRSLSAQLKKYLVQTFFL